MSNQITLQKAASQLKVSEKSIRRYIKAGRIKASLIKGDKGYEYRIDASQLKSFHKPPRGKNSHKKSSARTTRKPQRRSKKLSTKSKKPRTSRPIESLSEILEKRVQGKTAVERSSKDMVDYKTLYENLLEKYEQTLIILGALESKLNNRPATSTRTNEKVERMEDSMAKQEEIIMDLYQTLQLYKNEQNH